MEKKELKKYLFLGILIILIVYSYLIIKDFIVVILSSVILSYILLPLHKKMSKKISPYLSALICVLLSILVVSYSAYIIGQAVYLQISEILEKNSFEQVAEKIQSLIDKTPFPNNFLPSAEKTVEYILRFISKALLSLIKGIINLILVFFFTYFILIYWEKMKKEFYEIIPFENKKEILEKIKKISDSIIKTSLIIAIIEGVVSLLFFTFLGIKYSLVLSFIIFLFAFIPLIGPGIIWTPLMIYNLIIKNYLFSVLFLIYGLIISYGIDAILRDLISAKKAKINPLIMLIGFIGGINLFGLVGIILGPLILSVTLFILTNHKD